ncbi:hypothetical protein GUJ93_ZPchr0002g23740 [Zizania palustris]|uniref:Uncharacterized protein n=1 Tax=Zizania palustris TaxID=103762 RepID=A0A8J5RTV8_ZIZPA|nr:hypothetical protein GUJ93_ZPchr0002g23740 [Zizania palustris]
MPKHSSCANFPKAYSERLCLYQNLSAARSMRKLKSSLRLEVVLASSEHGPHVDVEGKQPGLKRLPVTQWTEEMR